MGSPKAAIVFRARVVAVEEKFIKTWLDGYGDNARFTNEPKGWFVGLEDSYEYFHVGNERPNIKIGDIATIRITFDAQPS